MHYACTISLFDKRPPILSDVGQAVDGAGGGVALGLLPEGGRLLALAHAGTGVVRGGAKVQTFGATIIRPP